MNPFTREKRFKTRSAAGTLALAATFAEMLPGPRVIILQGELGAGKTTLVKGWIEALDAGAACEVTSPTFTLVHEYPMPRGHVFHLDLYRLETEQELESLGLEEMVSSAGALLLIEWGEKFASLVERADAVISIGHLEDDERSLLVHWRE